MNKKYFDIFETDPGRAGSGAIKWDEREHVFGHADTIPLWVADMDFTVAECISSAIEKRAAHHTYGYTIHGEKEYISACGWMKRRHGVDVKPEWFLFSSGVVDSIMFSLYAFTEPNERVLIQPPIYGPFPMELKKTGRTAAMNRLLNTPEGWRIDFEDMENHLKSGVKCMLLCNPHNPVGRVWTEDEIKRTCELADKYGALIIADEIHADFALRGAKTTRFIKYANPDRLVTLISATKSFNIAGLNQSNIIVPNKDLREKLAKQMSDMGACGANIFGAIAQDAAFTSGDEWMDNLIEYLSDSRDEIEKYINENLPEVKIHHLEGTYLMWLDFSSLGMEQDALKRFLYDECSAGLQDGTFFGEEGRGFMRMNIGTQRSNVMRALENIRAALDKR